MNRNAMKNRIIGVWGKKIVPWILASVLLLPIACITDLVGVCYAAKISGGKEVRPGQSVTLRLSVDSSVVGYQGTISYDSSFLELKNVEPVNDDLLKESYANYDTGFIMVTHKEPVSKILKITFTVLDTAKIGSTTTVSFTDGEIVQGTEKESINDIYYTLKVVEPKSEDATLKSLTVRVYEDESDALSFSPDFNPAFSPDTILYRIMVPNEYSRYKLDGVCNHSAASIIYDDEGELEEGMNLVEVTVRAEDGSEKAYTLMLFRERRPEISQVVSDESVFRPDESSEESSEENIEESAMVSEAEDEISEDTLIEEISESLVTSATPSDVSAPELMMSSPYQPDGGNWTGIILCIAAVGGVCVITLVIRVFILLGKKHL